MQQQDILSQLTAAIYDDSDDIGAPAAEEWASGYLEWAEHLRKEELRIKPEHVPSVSFLVDKVAFRNGEPTVVYGPVGSGKTTVSVVAIEYALLLHPDWVFPTNIPFYWNAGGGQLQAARPAQLTECRSMSSLLRMAAKARLEGGRRLAPVLDETDSKLVSQQWREDHNLNTKRLLYIARKLHLRGPLFIYHTYRDIPDYLRELSLSHAVGKCEGKENSPDKEVRFWLKHSPPRVYRWVFPRSTIPFSSHGHGSFEFDVDMAQLEKYTFGTARECAEQILDYLDRADAEKEEEEQYERSAASRKRKQLQEDERTEAEIRRMLMNGSTYEEIRRELRVSPNIIARVARAVRWER